MIFNEWSDNWNRIFSAWDKCLICYIEFNTCLNKIHTKILIKFMAIR